MKSLRLAGLLLAAVLGASLGGPGLMGLVADTDEVVQQEQQPVEQPPGEEQPPAEQPPAEQPPAEEQPVSEPAPEGEEQEDVETEDEEADDAEDAHGARVAAVARCAPRGKDPRFASLSQRNHGAFVKAAARGQTISVGGADHDLSTDAGVASLCAALDEMKSDDASATAAKKNGAKAKAKKDAAVAKRDKAKAEKAKSEKSKGKAKGKGKAKKRA